MKPADDIKRYFQKSTLSTNPDRHEEIFEKIVRAQDISKTTGPVLSRLNIGRIIMKNHKIKLGIAATIILVIAIGIPFLRQTNGIAWAIEQSIDALSRYNAIEIEGSMSQMNEDGKVQIHHGKYWAVANEDQTKVEKERVEIGGVPTIVTNGKQTWRYDPKTNTVMKNSPYRTPEIWFGSRLLKQLKSYHDSGLITNWQVTYGKDPETDKQRVFLACAWLDKRYNGPRSMWLQFDAESNLLVSFKQWENADMKGPADYVAEKITYHENLPDELFEFEIPEGATVLEN